MVGQHKRKLGIHGQKQEDDERIRECNQKGRPRVVPQCALLLTALVHFLRGVGMVGVPAEAQQQYATRYLQIESVLIVGDKIHHKRHSEASKCRIDNVAHSGTYASGKAEPAALIQCALYAQNTYRSHRCAGNHTDQHPLEDEV